MKTPKIYHARLSKTGRTYPVTLRFTHYNQNKTLAVQLVQASGRVLGVTFATITVNLSDPTQDDTHAFLDTNNCPWVEEFLRDNGIAEPAYGGLKMQSGFCTYPLYKFNIDSQWESEAE